MRHSTTSGLEGAAFDRVPANLMASPTAGALRLFTRTVTSGEWLHTLRAHKEAVRSRCRCARVRTHVFVSHACVRVRTHVFVYSAQHRNTCA